LAEILTYKPFFQIELILTYVLRGDATDRIISTARVAQNGKNAPALKRLPVDIAAPRSSSTKSPAAPALT
jgi:hypothetical protein